MLVSHAEFLFLITFFFATENLSPNISIFFVIILKDDIDAGRESLIKGLCIYLNEDPNVLVQEYMVSVLLVDCGFTTFQNVVNLLIQTCTVKVHLSSL